MKSSFLDDAVVASLSEKRVHYDEPTYTKDVSIINNIRENNLELHIFRYKALYRIYNKLYLETYNRKLADLNYYIEDDGSLYAEIKDSHKEYLPKRLKMHIALLRRVKNDDKSLRYGEATVINTSNERQLSLFQ